MRHVAHALAPIVTALWVAATSPSASAQSNAIVITPDQFGINNVYRPGEITPLRVSVEASSEAGLDDAQTVWVQWEVPNVDGDIAEYGRPMTVNRGRPFPVWLYAPLEPESRTGAQWVVRAFSYDDGRRGRELGGTRLSAPGNAAVPSNTSVLGVVGSGPVGLNTYVLQRTQRGATAATAHEDTRVVFGIRPPDLPDRWEGLRLFDALVWTDMPPQDLPAAQLEALREWTRRGGHLVIVLPDAGNPWGIGEQEGRTGLHALFPTRTPRVDDAVPLSDLMPVLCKSTQLRRDVSATMPIRVFGTLEAGPRGAFLDEAASAIDNGYEPLVALPDGRIVAIQRLFGHGRITLLGIDVTNGQIRQVPLDGGRTAYLPQADVLWNRILGRRQDAPSAGELRAMEDDQRFNPATPREATIGTGDLFVEETKHSGQVGSGLVVALVLFISYWLVATIGAFGALKQVRQTRHSWLAFAAAAGLFTVIAWVSVAAMRENQVMARHVTFLDYVARFDASAALDDHDPQLARGTSWMSLYVPGYSSRVVDIASAPANGPVPAQRDLLFSWTPPGRAMAPFPNVDRYGVDVRVEPDSFALPTRSTATMLEAHWLGGIDPEWGDMIRIDPDDPLRVVIDTAGQEQLRGSLVNKLPAALRGVRVIWIQGRRMPDREYVRSGDEERAWIASRSAGALPNLGKMASISTWASGESRPIVFEDGAEFALARNLTEIVAPYRESAAFGGAPVSVARPGDRRDLMRMLSLYGMLDPPEYTKDPQQNRSDTVSFRRLLGRELDLSPWFVRPCVIVIGMLENVALPLPMRLDDRQVEGDGVVVVRWVCPLPLDPAVAFRLETEGI